MGRLAEQKNRCWRARLGLAAFFSMVSVVAPVDTLGETHNASGSATKRRIAAADSLDAVIDRLVRQERYVSALAIAADQARLRAESLGPRASETLSSFHRIARIAHRSGDQDTAERTCNLVLALRESQLGPSHPDVAESLALKAMIVKYAHKFDASLSYTERGLEIMKAHPGRNLETVASLLQARANVKRRRGIDGGVDDYEKALRVRRKMYSKPALPLADNLTWLAWSLMQLGRHDEAFRHFDEAETQLRDMGLADHSLMGVILAARAEGHAVAGRWSEAESLFRLSVPIFERSQQGFFPGFSRRRLPLNASQTHALALLKLGRWEEAWLAKQKYANDIQMDFVTLANWRHTNPDEHGQVQVLRRRLLDVRSKLQESSAPGDDVDAAMISNEHLTTMVERFEVMAKVFKREQTYLKDNSNKEVSVADVQRYLSQESAFIGVVTTQIADYHSVSNRDVLHSMWVYIIRHEGPITWVPILEAKTSVEYREMMAVAY